MKYYKFIILIALSVSVCGAVVHAQSTSTSSSTERSRATDPRRMEVKEKIENMKKERDDRLASSTEKRTVACENISSRIDKRLNDFENVASKHESIYERHKENLLKIATKLDEAGVSSSKLRTDIAALDDLISDFNDNKTLVRLSLEDLENQSCASDATAFKTKLEALRFAQKGVADDAKEIGVFIRTTLKQDILDLQEKYRAENVTRERNGVENRDEEKRGEANSNNKQ